MRILIGVLGAVAVGLLVLLILPLLGVNIGFGPFASAEPSASASASASASTGPSGSEPASPSGSGTASIGPTFTPTPPDEGWICGLPVTLAATGPAILHTTDISVSTHPDFDRISFEYQEAGSPAFEMRNARPPFTKDPSGLPMTVNGSNFMRITLNGATKLADDGSLTYDGPTNFEPDFPQLVQLIEQGDFEAVNSWYVGLDGGDCIRAAVVTGPSRIIIDVQH
jgi:hypothetical protein